MVPKRGCVLKKRVHGHPASVPEYSEHSELFGMKHCTMILPGCCTSKLSKAKTTQSKEYQKTKQIFKKYCVVFYTKIENFA